MLTSRLPNYSQESLLDSRTEPACSAVKERTCIPSFISKTFEILEKEQHNDLISWSENGLSFYVKNIKEFEEQILPSYFRHKNFASFVRQLNMYDFHKVRGEQKHIFSHKLFQRDQKHLLTEIKRKCFKKQRDNDDDGNQEESQEEVPVPKQTKVLGKENIRSKEPRNPEESQKRKRLQLGRYQQNRRTLELIEKENQKNRQRNRQLMDEIVFKLSRTDPRSDRQIRERINELKTNPRYDNVLNGKYNIVEIYKKLRDNLYDSRPRNTLEELDELSIQEDILYNQIERPSKFRIASLTNFETQHFINRSGRQVFGTISGISQEDLKEFF